MGAIPRFFPGSSPPSVFPSGGYAPSGQLIILGTTFLLISIMFLFIKNTKMGAAIRAISQDGEAALMMASAWTERWRLRF